MFYRGRVTATALVIAIAISAGIAHAEPTPEDRTLARSLFEEGRNLAKDGRFAEACPKLEESQRLDPGIGTLFNLADCFEHQGRTASAWSSFSEAGDLAKRANQADRETIARDRANALLPKLAKIKVHVATPPQGLSLSIDGKALSAAVIDTEIPVDPGDHKIGASAPGKQKSETLVTAREATVVPVDIAALADGVSEPPPPTVAQPPSTSQPPQTTPPSDTAPKSDGGLPWQKKAAFVAGGVGVVGLGLGTAFGLSANGDWSDAKKSCSNGACDAAGYSKWSDAHSSATLSTVSFTVGAVLIAAAVVLYVTAPNANDTPPHAASYPFANPLGGTF